jgi:hypothetical protein
VASGGVSGSNLSSGAVTLSGGTLLDTATGTLGNAITLGAGTNTLAAATGVTATFSGAISGGNNVTLGAGTNNGTVVFSSANTYSGVTTVGVGKVQLGNNSALGTGSASVSGGAALDLNGMSISNNLTVNGTGISSGGALTNSSATTGSVSGTVALASASSVGSNAGNITLSGVVSGAYALTKLGTNTLTLSGANTYSGGTAIGAGTFLAGNNSALGTGAATVSSGAALNLFGFAIANNLTLNGTGISSAGVLTNSSATAGAVSGTVALASASSVGGSAGNITLSGVVSGAYALTKLGTNTLNLSGANSYSGGTTISVGTLLVGNNGALGTGAATVNSGAALDLYGTSITNNLTLNGAGVNSAGALINSSPTIGSVSGTAALASASSVGGSAGNITLSGVVSGANALTKIGTNTLTLSGANIYTGGTTITAGTLVATSANSLGGNSATLTIASAGTLDLQNSVTLGSLSMSGSARIINTSGSSALTVSGASTLSNSVTTTGTQTYNGAITLAGNTSLTAGLFAFSNASTSGAYDLSLLHYGSRFTADQSLAGLTLGAATTSFTVGATSNSSAITLPVNIAIAGPITLYGGAISVNANLSDTNAVANSGIQLLGRGAFTLAAGKTITTTNAKIVVTGSQVVINNTSANAISAGGSGNYWRIWSANTNSYNVITALADKLGNLVFDYKQYNVSYGDTVLGTGNGLLYSYAPVLSFALTGAVSKTYDGTNVATLVPGNFAAVGAVGGDVITVATPTSGTFASANIGSALAVTASGAVSLTSASASTGKPVYGYQLSSVSAGAATGNVGVINAKSLITVLTANDKVFDTTNDATGTLSLSGFIGNDTGTVIASSLTFASANVAYSGGNVASQTVTASGLTLSSNLSNYTLASPTATGSAKITPAPLTITATNQAGFVTVAPNLSSSDFVASGLLGGQTLASVSLSTTATASSPANTYPLNITGAVGTNGTNLGNYSLTYVPGTYTVARADSLLIATNNVSTVYGTNASATPVSISYLAGGTTLTTLTSQTSITNAGVTTYTYVDGASGSISFSLVASGTATSGSGNVNVGSYGFVANNLVTTSSNVVPNAPLVVTGNYTVIPKSVSVIATAATSTYTAESQTQGYTSGLFIGDQVTISGQATGTSVGTYTSSLSAAGADKPNYNLAFTNATLTIAPATLTVTGSSRNVTYNGLQQNNGAAQVTGFLQSDAGTVTGYAQGTNAGTYNDNLMVTPSGNTSLSNYNVVITQGALNIAKATLTVTGATGTGTYNGNAQTNAAPTIVGTQSGDTFNITGMATATHVGAYADNLSVAAAGNTLLSNYGILKTNGSLTISKANLSVTGANHTLTYNGYAQTNTGAVVVGGQTGDSFTIKGYATATNTGTYTDALSVEGVGSTQTSNYNITVTNGSLVVTAAPLTITGNTTTLTYSGAEQTNSFTTLGLMQPDAVNAVSGLASRTSVGRTNDQLSNAIGSGLSNYIIAYVNGSLSVNPATLTITGATTSRTYTAEEQTNTFTTSGLRPNDSVTSVNGLASAIQVGRVADQLSGAVGTGLSNYTINYVLGSLTITPAPLTITGATSSSTYTAVTQTNTFTASGLLRSDKVSGVVGLASATTVGNYSDNLSGATGPGLSNYEISYVNGSLSISPAPLTITGATTTRRYTAQAQTNTYGVSGLLGSDAVTDVAGLASRTNVGSGADQLANATGSGLSNYNITYVNGSLNLTPAPLTISGATTSNVYTGSSQANTYAVRGLLGYDTVTGLAGLAAANDVGTTADNLSGATGQGIINYSVQYVNGSLSIIPAALTIAANNVASFVLKPTETLTFSASGLLGSDSVSTATMSTLGGLGAAAGAYPINISGASGSGLGNYTITYLPGTYTVVPAGQLLVTTAGSSAAYGTPVAQTPLTVSYLSPDNTTIGNLTQTSAVQANGITTYTYSDNLSTPTTVSFTLAPSNSMVSGSGNMSVGVYGLAAAAFSKSGPNLTSNTVTVTGNAVVNPKSASITGEVVSTIYNASLQSTSSTGNSGYTFSGVLAGDQLLVAGIASGINAGRYASALSVSGADAGNYTFDVTNNPLTIALANLTITGSNRTSVYNAAIQTNSTKFTVSGLRGQDMVAAVAGQGTGRNVGTYTDVLNNATGAGLSNYAITYANGGLSITPAPVSVSLNANNKVYDATNTATGALNVSGAFQGDSVSAMAANIAFADSNAGLAKTVTASGLAITGSASNNYALTHSIVTATASITVAPLIITGATNSVIYNGAVQSNASSFTTSGLFGADLVTAVSGQSSGKDVGTYNDALRNAVGAGLSNYNITYQHGALSVTRAPLTVTGATTTTGYNATPQTNAYSVRGLKGTEAVTVSGMASGVNVGSYNDVLSVSAATGTSLSNYSLSTTNGSLTINRAVLTPVLNANNKVYDANTTAAGSVGLLGVFSSDVVSGAASTIDFANANAGVGKSVTATGIALSGAAAGNYVLASTSATDSATITPAPLTVAANNQASFVTQATNTLTYSVIGILGSDAVSSATMQTQAGATTSAGTYALNISNAQGAGVSNYAITYQPGLYTVVPSGQLLITTNGSTSTYGSATTAPTSVTASYLDANSNQINTLTLRSLSAGTYVFSDGANTSVTFSLKALSPINSGAGNLARGIYGISVDTFSKTGANLTSDTATVTGDYIVTPMAATVTSNDQSLVYSGAAQSAGYTSSQLQAQDNVLISGRATGTTVGTYQSNLSASGTDINNYVFTFVDRAFAITPASLTVTGATTTRTYSGGPQVNSSFSTTGLVGADSLGSVLGQATGTNVGVYADNLSGAAGTGLSNYNISYVNGGLTITPAQLRITGSTTSVVSNGLVQTNSQLFTTSGLLGADAVSAVSGQASGTFAGTYSDSLRGATGAGLTNYSITYVNGSLEIKPAPTSTAANAASGVMQAGSSSSQAPGLSSVSAPSSSTSSASTDSSAISSGNSSTSTSTSTDSSSAGTASAEASTAGSPSAGGTSGTATSTSTDAGSTATGGSASTTAGTSDATNSGSANAGGTSGTASSTSTDAGSTATGGSAATTTGTSDATNSGSATTSADSASAGSANAGGTSGTATSTSTDAGFTATGGSAATTTATSDATYSGSVTTSADTASAGSANAGGTSGTASSTSTDAGSTATGGSASTTAGTSDATNSGSATTSADSDSPSTTGAAASPSISTVASSSSTDATASSDKASETRASSTDAGSINALKNSEQGTTSVGLVTTASGIRMMTTAFNKTSDSLSVVIKVEVPAVLVQSKFEFRLPEGIAEQLAIGAVNTAPVAKLLNQPGLPDWLSFDEKTLSFSAKQIPPGALPITVEIQAGKVKVILVIGEISD